MKSQIINHKKQSCSSVLHDKFSIQQKNYLTKPFAKYAFIYLFKHLYFFCVISTQFADFASLKIQMQIIFAKPFNVLNNAA